MSWSLWDLFFKDHLTFSVFDLFLYYWLVRIVGTMYDSFKEGWQKNKEFKNKQRWLCLACSAEGDKFEFYTDNPDVPSKMMKDHMERRHGESVTDQ